MVDKVNKVEGEVLDLDHCQTLQDLFRDKTRWTRKQYARDNKGYPVMTRDPYATSFCLAGGLIRLYDNLDERDKNEAKLRQVTGRSLTAFNDDPATTIQDIQRVVRQAGV